MSKPIIDEVIYEINRGGFGIVERVRLEDGREVARKTFAPGPGLNPDSLEKFRQRFIREVKTQEKLSADYFIPILGYDLSGETPWFIMPLADKDFQTEIDKNENPLDNVDALSDILNSLEQLHELDLVHRDLKPQNVLYQDGKWKLSDLGLISSDKEILSKTITSSESGYGTALYCAPEQVHHFKRVTGSADIYSFGAILHDIFGSGSRTPYSKLKAKGPIGMVMEKCTEEKPQNRFKDVSSLRSAFLSILARVNAHGGTPDSDEWINFLQKSDEWTEDNFESFYMAIHRIEGDISQIMFEITDEKLRKLHVLSVEVWESFVGFYLNWIYETQFMFDYCDVLIGHIRTIYQLSLSNATKAKAVVVGARLGASHNRWYVMGIVLKMANEKIDGTLASRIEIEIHVGGRDIRNHFIRCVEGIKKSIDDYHEIIQGAIRN